MNIDEWYKELDDRDAQRLLVQKLALPYSKKSFNKLTKDMDLIMYKGDDSEHSYVFLGDGYLIELY